MFDQEKISPSEGSTGYGENTGNDRSFPPDGMTRPGPQWKVQPTKPILSPARIIVAVVIAVIVLGGILGLSQSIAIQQRQYEIQGKIGTVWNEVDRASQLLQQDAALLNATIASQNDAITKIAQARSQVAAIKTSQGMSDPNAALAAANQMNGGIRVFIENYPDYGVGSNSHSVLVQIEGSFNRIEYARQQLITEQTEFNKWLLTQIPMNLFYHPVQILGSNANPAQPVPVPNYGQPAP